MARPEDIYPAISEAYNAGDLETLVSLYDPQAVFVIKPGRVVIEELRTKFDWIICDSPAGIERGATLAMRYVLAGRQGMVVWWKMKARACSCSLAPS